MQSFAYFPSIVYRDERPDLANDLLETCKSYLNKARHPDLFIVQSEFLGSDAKFLDFSNYILSLSAGALAEQGYDVSKYEFYLQGLWAQEIGKNSGTNVHVHKNSQICGWFFLKAPENGAYPAYYDTRLNKSMVELDFNQSNEITNATNVIYFNNILPGTLLFSNSWMNHQMIGGTSDEPTICLHFVVSHKEKLCSMS